MIKTTAKRTYDFLSLFDRMIYEMKSGKKLLPNGNCYRESTITIYQFVRNNLGKFSAKTGFELRVRSVRKLTERELIAERNYWKKFYRKYTDFLYREVEAYDNYVGCNIKIIRTFFGYIERELLIDTGKFHRNFYVNKEDVPVLALTPEQLHFLIYNKEFEKKLSDRLKKIKDIFVFGSTVALRYSDLMKLTRSNLLVVDEYSYLCVRSKKTGTDTRVKLPDYAIEIAERYSTPGKNLLPVISNYNLNKSVKELTELAGWTEPLKKIRTRRGKPRELKLRNSPLRFCDHVSAHTMRRTAITTMLTLGVPEHIVRNVSGHSAGSKEFFKYVAIAQIYKDRELDKMHEKLKERYG